jgi:hypothetical protein
MEYFRDNGYHVAGSGKLMHHHRASVWSEFKHKADYGPFVYDGKDRVAHPSVPQPFNSIGSVDGSYAPLSDLPYGPNQKGNKGWIYGTWGKVNKFKYVDEDNRDPTPDERNAAWAENKIRLGCWFYSSTHSTARSQALLQYVPCGLSQNPRNQAQRCRRLSLYGCF